MTITAMTVNPARGAVCLPSGHGISLKDAAGVVLTAVKGRIWLTMEGEHRDIDLRRGATYTIERDGLTLVNAMEPSIVDVRVPHTRRAAWRGWISRCWEWLVRAGKARARARIRKGVGTGIFSAW